MEGESGEQVGDELECDIISRVLCARLTERVTRRDVDSMDEVMHSEEFNVNRLLAVFVIKATTVQC